MQFAVNLFLKVVKVTASVVNAVHAVAPKDLY